MPVSYRRLAQEFNKPETDKVGLEPALLRLEFDPHTKKAAFESLDGNPLAQRISVGSGGLVYALAHVAAEEANSHPLGATKSDRTLDTDEVKTQTVMAAKLQLRSDGVAVTGIQEKVEALYDRILSTAKRMNVLETSPPSR